MTWRKWLRFITETRRDRENIRITETVFCDMKPCILLEVYGHFQGIWFVHLQGRSVNQASKKPCLPSDSCFNLFAWSSTLKMKAKHSSWNLDDYTAVLFIVVAVRTSDPTSLCQFRASPPILRHSAHKCPGLSSLMRHVEQSRLRDPLSDKGKCEETLQNWPWQFPSVSFPIHC